MDISTKSFYIWRTILISNYSDASMIGREMRDSLQEIICYIKNEPEEEGLDEIVEFVASNPSSGGVWKNG